MLISFWCTIGCIGYEQQKLDFSENLPPKVSLNLKLIGFIHLLISPSYFISAEGKANFSFKNLPLFLLSFKRGPLTPASPHLVRSKLHQTAAGRGWHRLPLDLQEAVLSSIDESLCQRGITDALLMPASRSLCLNNSSW